VFAGRAYREGLDQGERDARSGREKRPRPSFWKSFVSRASYPVEFVRGYRAGYELGCKGQKIEERQREARAMPEERWQELREGRTANRERDDQRAR